MICEHASNHIPAHYNNLELAKNVLATIEIRQDEIGDGEGIDKWCDILAEYLKNIAQSKL